MNAKSLLTMDYENKSDSTLGENEPNTNPNKPNLLRGQMNITFFIKRDYKNPAQRRLEKNKPNQTQFKPNFPKAKMNVNFFVTKDYENQVPGGTKSNFRVPHNRKSSQSRRIDKKSNSELKNRDAHKVAADREGTGEPGFGPGLTDPESVVLPLHYSPRTQVLAKRTGRSGSVYVRYGPNYNHAVVQDSTMPSNSQAAMKDVNHDQTQIQRKRHVQINSRLLYIPPANIARRLRPSSIILALPQSQKHEGDTFQRGSTACNTHSNLLSRQLRRARRTAPICVVLFLRLICVLSENCSQGLDSMNPHLIISKMVRAGSSVGRATD